MAGAAVVRVQQAGGVLGRVRDSVHRTGSDVGGRSPLTVTDKRWRVSVVKGGRTGRLGGRRRRVGALGVVQVAVRSEPVDRRASPLLRLRGRVRALGQRLGGRDVPAAAAGFTGVGAVEVWQT